MSEQVEEIYKPIETPALAVLTKLRWFGGFPLGLETLSVDIWRPLMIPAFFLASEIICSYNLFVMVGGNNYLESLNEFSEAFNLPTTDMFMHFMFTVLATLVSFAFFILFALKRKGICKIYMMISDLPQLLQMSEFQFKKKTLRVTILLSVATILALINGTITSFVNSAYGGKMEEFTGRKPGAFQWFSLGMYSCSVVVWAINPLVIGALVLYADISYSLIQLLHAWKTKIETSHEAWMAKMRMTNVNSLILEAKHFCKFASLVNEALAPIIFLLHAHFLILGILTTYGAAGIFFKNLGDDPNGERSAPLPGLLSVAFFFAAPINIAAIEILGTLGTHIMLAANDSATALEDAMDQMSCCLGAVAAARLREACKIKPYQAFEVSNGNNVAILSSLLTFMVVMLQFRVSEASP